jgi:hypothetical protein
MHVVFAVLETQTSVLTPHELVAITKKTLLQQSPAAKQQFPYLSHIEVNSGVTISSSGLLIDLVARAKLWVKDNWDDKTKKNGQKLSDLKIHENPAIASECLALKRFLLGLESDLGPLAGIKSLPLGDQLGQVTFGYHATGVESVVSAICHDGYDPQYRNGQAYARGEYFSKAGQEDYSINYYSGTTGLLVVNALLGGHYAHTAPHLVIANPVKDGWFEQGANKVRIPHELFSLSHSLCSRSSTIRNLPRINSFRISLMSLLPLSLNSQPIAFLYLFCSGGPSHRPLPAVKPVGEVRRFRRSLSIHLPAKTNTIRSKCFAMAILRSTILMS